MFIEFWLTPFSDMEKVTVWFTKPNYFSFGLCYMNAWSILPFYLAKQFLRVAWASKGTIVLGGLITSIVLALGIDILGLEQPWEILRFIYILVSIWRWLLNRVMGVASSSNVAITFCLFQMYSAPLFITKAIGLLSPPLTLMMKSNQFL